MLKRKKKEKQVEVSETELSLSSAAQNSEEVTEAQPTEITQVAEETIAIDTQPEPLLVPTQGHEYVAESSNDKMAQLANTLNSEFKKSGNGLAAHIAKVSNNITYVLIKATNSSYCFARIGQPKESSRATLEVEFLSNVPSHAHSQISEICKSLNISDSKRLFFHPSGIL